MMKIFKTHKSYIIFILILFSALTLSCNEGTGGDGDPKPPSSSDMSTNTNTNGNVFTSNYSVATTNVITQNVTNVNQSITSGQIFITEQISSDTNINHLKNKIFVWLDASKPVTFALDGSGKLTNWYNINQFDVIATNFNATNTETSKTTNVSLTSTTNFVSHFSISTNVFTNGNIISNLITINITNIVSNTFMKTIITSNSTNIDVSYKIASAISATPKSDVTGNINLVVSNGTLTSNNYVKVDYEGTDRVGFKIDTASMGNTHKIKAFYLVTKTIQGNNSWHVPLGYDNLAENKRFISKNNSTFKYEAGNTARTKAGLTLNDNYKPREYDFDIPNNVHLISDRNLDIAKSALAGTLGTFPTSALGGEQNIKELIVFTNDISFAEHSNIVKYLFQKWNITKTSNFTTNLYSSFSASGTKVIDNAIDNDQATTFKLNQSSQNAIAGNMIFTFQQQGGSILDISTLNVASLGLSKGYTNLVLRTGINVPGDSI